MIQKAIASSIMAVVLSSAKEEVIKTAEAQIKKIQAERIRKNILAQVTTQYIKELEHNITGYIQSIEASSAEISFEGKPGQAFINRAESAIKEFETYIEKQHPDGAVIKYLQRRYNEEGIRIVTGKLYGGHYIGKKGQSSYEVANKMGYAGAVDKRKPWLSSEKTTQGIEEMLANAALEIFDLSFEGVDFSSELALLKFTPSGRIKGDNAGMGFGGLKVARSTKTKKRTKRKS
jgi:hypothetical protein